MKVTNFLAIPAFVSWLLYLIKPIWMAWASIPLPNWFRIAGIMIAFAGFALLQ
jgi:hypothetical protein